MKDDAWKRVNFPPIGSKCKTSINGVWSPCTILAYRPYGRNRVAYMTEMYTLGWSRNFLIPSNCSTDNQEVEHRRETQSIQRGSGTCSADHAAELTKDILDSLIEKADENNVRNAPNASLAVDMILDFARQEYEKRKPLNIRGSRQ